ncbi:hypothetical protein GS937_17795 [Rhodococcus hoagii]|nr:hypothetical protein [Prescottella equi]
MDHPARAAETHEMVGSRADMVVAHRRGCSRGPRTSCLGHGDFMRAVIARWVELPVTEGRRFLLDPAAHTVLSYEHGFRTIRAHNVTPREGLQ